MKHHDSPVILLHWIGLPCVDVDRPLHLHLTEVRKSILVGIDQEDFVLSFLTIDLNSEIMFG